MGISFVAFFITTGFPFLRRSFWVRRNFVLFLQCFVFCSVYFRFEIASHIRLFYFICACCLPTSCAFLVSLCSFSMKVYGMHGCTATITYCYGYLVFLLSIEYEQTS
ncbi:hypothetical protein BJ508DRAFT_21024 [Ascobolus immersus RN42]|uniref:Uncharacterized protein n=1 Tax=Ascobolus immersus RN42 TaxID=1160509 RepID=A0A3N4IFR3_ASCIM|nr:hypothetical protein BJ508DRAFT_21024 [Ascobolus immersus RN42]